MKEVFDLAIKLRLEQESIWIFLRTILADYSLANESQSIVRELEDYHKSRGVSLNDDIKRLLPDSNVTKAICWIQLRTLSSPKSPSPASG